MYKSIFETDCERIPIRIFWLQFCHVINEVVPPTLIKKYANKPITVCYSIQEISYALKTCTTTQELAEAISLLPESKKHSLVWDLLVMGMEVEALPSDSYVLVPENPLDYLKPYFEGKLTISNILCESDN